MPLYKPTFTFKRVGGAKADVLIARGWRRMGSYKAEDYESHLLMLRHLRDDAPAGEDSYGGE